MAIDRKGYVFPIDPDKALVVDVLNDELLQDLRAGVSQGMVDRTPKKDTPRNLISMFVDPFKRFRGGTLVEVIASDDHRNLRLVVKRRLPVGPKIVLPLPVGARYRDKVLEASRRVLGTPNK